MIRPLCQHNKMLRYLAEASAFAWQVSGIWNNIPGFLTPQHPGLSPDAAGFNKSTVHNVSSAFGHQLSCCLFFSSLPHQAATPRQGLRAMHRVRCTSAICRLHTHCGPFAIAAQPGLLLALQPPLVVVCCCARLVFGCSRFRI